MSGLTPQTEIIGKHIKKPKVFPCRPVSKAPYEQGGFHGAVDDPDKIVEWFAKYREALVGYATGGGIAVIDIDIKKGKNGFEKIAELEAQYGLLPNTFTVKTMSGGEHRYFRYNAITNTLKCSSDKIATGIDVRASGGYVIVPPSGGYSVLHDVDVADLPADWVALIEEKPKQGTVSTIPYQATADDADIAVDCLDFISADCSRDDWVAVGMALKSVGVPFYEFDAWSRTAGTRYGGERQTLNVWESFKGDGYGIGTLVFMAKQAGYRRRNAGNVTQPPATQKPAANENDTDAPPDTATHDDITAYYDVNRKEMLVRTSEGSWNPYSETQFKRILKGKGYPTTVAVGAFVSEVDRIIIETQDKRSLAYAGGLAGWPSGVHETDCGRVLVTKGAELITPTPGNWDNLRVFFETLFADYEQQVGIFYGWMKVAIDSLYNRSFRPGQCLVLTGEKGCGKSLLQLLITEMLGGRFARPYQYMAGKTEFNADMFTAEHLAIEDDVPSTKLADRRSFGAKIKEITANQGQRLHAKNRDAIILPVFWRITVSVNDEPENLMILPPIDESLTDKIILTRARVATLPCSTQTNEGRLRCWDLLTGEIPAFLHWIQNWQIPEEIQSARYGVKEFHHPEIMEALAELSPEAKMEQIIDGALFSGPVKITWTGSAADLEQALVADAVAGYEARRLLSFNTACGVYLSRLATKYPERYERKHTSEGNFWSIRPPEPRKMKGVKGYYDLKLKNIYKEGGLNVANLEKPFTPFTDETQDNATENLEELSL